MAQITEKLLTNHPVDDGGEHCRHCQKNRHLQASTEHVLNNSIQSLHYSSHKTRDILLKISME